MTSIVVGTCCSSSNNLKGHYLKNKRHFLDFLFKFLKRALNLEHFEKKDEYPRLVITRSIDSEGGGYLNV